ncbi:MAG: malto-oligosyltrehalose trehalohydrolase [Actinomycetales bacterium]
MHRFSVWSPYARDVDLVLGHSLAPDAAPGRRLAMHPGEDGWWSLDVPDAGPGTDYAFSLDGGTPIPDPRSAWQPEGVHGPSRVFDPGQHRWKDGDWAGRGVRGRVIYEMHVGTFTAEGTLDAAIHHLDHLSHLGVDVVEIMPVAAFPGTWGWGYDGVHLYAVHDPYGGPAALQRFVDACHRRGLAVCLDVVYNHLGPSGNYLLQYGPYFTDTHHTPWGSAVNLDAEGNGPVRRYLIDNALRWFRDFHIDALRLDAVHELRDGGERHLLAELSDETAALAAELDRPLDLIAESDLNDAVMVTPTSRGGLGMSAQWDDDIHHALHSLLTGETQGYYSDFGSMQTLAKALTEVFVHDGGHSTFRGRDWGAPVDPSTTSGHAFLAYTTTHDQTGNRAIGDRLSAGLSLDRQAIAAAIVLTSPYTPMLFMGEEFAASTPWQFFTDHPEPDLAEAIRTGRRSEFADHGWSADEVPDPQDPATRDRSVLNWEDVHQHDGSRLLAWYRALIATRRREPGLRDGDLRRMQVDYDAEARWMVIHRNEFRLAINLSGQTATVPLDRTAQHVALAFTGARLRPRSVRLPADGVALVLIDASATVRDAVTGYLIKTADELRDAVARDDVHDMRVSCRRIRGVLRAHASVWQPESKERSVAIAERARQIARALSDDRDHEVAGEVIDEWAETDGWQESQRAAVHKALYPDPVSGSTPPPKPAVVTATPSLSSADARMAAADLADTVARFLAGAQWRGRADLPARGGLGRYRSRAAGRVTARAAAAEVTHPDEDPFELWHLVRKAAKRLRYTAEAGADAGDLGAKEVTAAAKNVQQTIGELQDARLVRDRLSVAGGEAVAAASQRAEETIAVRSGQIEPALDRLRAVMGLQSGIAGGDSGDAAPDDTSAPGGGAGSSPPSAQGPESEPAGGQDADAGGPSNADDR